MEREFHLWLFERQSAREAQTAEERLDVELGIGDDAAIVGSIDRRQVITADGLAEGTHFELDGSPERLFAVGHKLAGVNLSDLAAMGAVPGGASLVLQLPVTLSLPDVQQLYLGFETHCRQHQTVILGGDTNRWDGPLVISATFWGTLPNKASGWTLRGAQAGDVVLVSGSLGGSRLGRHLMCAPRVALAGYLNTHPGIHAATDVSDSLTSDLMAILQGSGLGCQLNVNQVPISPDVDDRLSDDRRREHALYDGEDFELLLCCDPDAADSILLDPALPTPLTRIGTLIPGSVGLVDAEGDSIRVRGYDH